MKRFNIVENGYDIDEVNRFIDIVIKRLEKLNNENVSYLSKIEYLNNKLNEKNGLNDNRLEKAILAVQETSDKIREISREEARLIIDEAKNNANAIVHEALVKAEMIEHDRMILEKNIKLYKDKTKALLESQLELIDDMDNIDF